MVSAANQFTGRITKKHAFTQCVDRLLLLISSFKNNRTIARVLRRSMTVEAFDVEAEWEEVSGFAGWVFVRRSQSDATTIRLSHFKRWYQCLSLHSVNSVNSPLRFGCAPCAKLSTYPNLHVNPALVFCQTSGPIRLLKTPVENGNPGV